MISSHSQPVSVFLKKYRNFLFFFFASLGAVLFFRPLRELLKFSFLSMYYSHVVLIPLVSGYFIYRWRKKIFSFSAERGLYLPGLVVTAASAAPYLIGTAHAAALSENDYLFFMTLSAVLFFIGGFLFFYGPGAFKAARFPLFFLAFMVPLPGFIMWRFVSVLQEGSTLLATGLFRLTGISFVREGFIFRFPDLGIRVARECSGIRSSVSLFITGVILAQLFLTKWRCRLTLLAAALPIAMFGNALRITVLTLLSLYVDGSFMYGNLHRKGGILFFALDFVLLLSLARLMRRFEKGKNPDQGKARA